MKKNLFNCLGFIILTMNCFPLSAQSPKTKLFLQPGVSNFFEKGTGLGNSHFSFGIMGLREIISKENFGLSIGLGINQYSSRRIFENLMFEDQMDPKSGFPGAFGTLVLKDQVGILSLPVFAEYGKGKVRFSTGIKSGYQLYAKQKSIFRTENAVDKDRSSLDVESSKLLFSLNQIVYFYFDIGADKKIFIAPQIEYFATPLRYTNGADQKIAAFHLSSGISF